MECGFNLLTYARAGSVEREEMRRSGSMIYTLTLRGSAGVTRNTDIYVRETVPNFLFTARSVAPENETGSRFKSPQRSPESTGRVPQING